MLTTSWKLKSTLCWRNTKVVNICSTIYSNGIADRLVSQHSTAVHLCMGQTAVQ